MVKFKVGDYVKLKDWKTIGKVVGTQYISGKLEYYITYIQDENNIDGTYLFPEEYLLELTDDLKVELL